MPFQLTIKIAWLHTLHFDKTNVMLTPGSTIR